MKISIIYYILLFLFLQSCNLFPNSTINENHNINQLSDNTGLIQFQQTRRSLTQATAPIARSVDQDRLQEFCELLDQLDITPFELLSRWIELTASFSVYQSGGGHNADSPVPFSFEPREPKLMEVFFSGLQADVIYDAACAYIYSYSASLNVKSDILTFNHELSLINAHLNQIIFSKYSSSIFGIIRSNIDSGGFFIEIENDNLSISLIEFLAAYSAAAGIDHKLIRIGREQEPVEELLVHSTSYNESEFRYTAQTTDTSVGTIEFDAFFVDHLTNKLLLSNCPPVALHRLFIAGKMRWVPLDFSDCVGTLLILSWKYERS